MIRRSSSAGRAGILVEGGEEGPSLGRLAGGDCFDQLHPSVTAAYPEQSVAIPLTGIIKVFYRAIPGVLIALRRVGWCDIEERYSRLVCSGVLIQRAVAGVVRMFCRLSYTV